MKIKLMTWMFCCLVLSLSAFAVEDSEKYRLFNSTTFVKNPLELRDPFKRKVNRSKKAKAKLEGFSSGIYSNVHNSLLNVSIEDIKVVGIIIGPERRAIVKIGGVPGTDPLNQDGSGGSIPGEVVYVKEGMRIGSDDAEIKAILPGGIVVVEKIRNVYDQDEYLETVIPVSDE